MKEVASILPEGTKIGVNYDGTKFIEDSIDELKFTLVLAGVMTSLVVWFFLGSFGAAVNIMLSIPTAIIATFMALDFFGFTLNTFTMLGLTLAVGLVVDDNIMILENISRLYKKGMSKVQASLQGTNEISFAALASSTAIVAIFLPLGFVSGIVGRYFYEFAITLCAAIAFSYIDAITLTPMRTSYLLGSDNEEGKRKIDRLMNFFEKKYTQALEVALKYRAAILLGAVVIAGLTFLLVNTLKREFTPPQDQSRLILFMKTPTGSSLEYTEKKVAEIEKILMNESELRRYFVAIGGFSGVESNTAFSYVTLKPKGDRPQNKELKVVLSQQEFANYLRKKIREQVKGIFVFIRDPSLGGFGTGSSYPIEFSLTGPSYDVLISESERVKKMMEESKFMVDIDSDFQGKIPELRIIPDRQKAMQRGVSVDEIGRTIQSMVSGVTAGKFSKGGRRYDIVVKIKESGLEKIHDISKINVRNNRGELIPLSDVTKIQEEKGLLSINRKDRARAITLTANLADGVSQGEALEFLRTKIKPSLKENYSLYESGSVQTYNESFVSLVNVIILGLIIAFMVLASQFNSFVQPISILSILPFSFTGAFIALKIADQSLNIYSMIGLILLMGIVKKNSIILVDFTNQVREQGKSVHEALMHACPIRLRPIIMTSVSTIAGTLPAALALGPGAETRVPMALTVIGGLFVSTLLTLFIVPCLYSYIPGKVDQERAEI
jgi:HAE1 family hydrophobic/amphiphilic exporter-1